MRTIGRATMSSCTDPAFLSLADRIEFLKPRMTWRDAVSMQKVGHLSSLTNFPALNVNSCRGMFLSFYPSVTASKVPRGGVSW